MDHWKLQAQQAKDLLTLCLADAIHQALSAQVGPFWFLEFARTDQEEEEKRRITRPGQSSINDLDLQALLKILRYRDSYADRILEFYGFLNPKDPYAMQAQKRQLRSLLDRLITDFRNQIEAHTRVSDIQKGNDQRLYGYREALEDMVKLSGIFQNVADRNGKSYHAQIKELSTPKKKSKLPLLLSIVIGCALVAGIVSAIIFWPEAPAQTPKKTPEAPTTGNVYYNTGNAHFDPGTLTLQPKHVYYDGNEIVAVCFVLNGTDATVSNIHVEKFILYDHQNRKICAAAFGEIKDMVLEPNQYAEWTFRFPAATVLDPEADLTALRVESRSAYYAP